MNTVRLIEEIKRQEKLVAEVFAKYEKRKAQFADGLLTYDELGDYADMWYYERTYLLAMKHDLRLVQEEDQE